MSHFPVPHSRTFGLFEQRIAGDESLLELARLRFQQAGMGAEMHAASPAELERILKFRPSPETPVVVHLARDIRLTEELGRSRIVEFATRFAGRVDGLIIHDQPEMAAPTNDLLELVRTLDSRLASLERCPQLFVEFAVGMPPDAFARFAGCLRELTRLSVCIDIGHVGIWQARHFYGQRHPGADVCAFKGQTARLPSILPEVQLAVASALPVVLGLVAAIGALGKPVHFHLHDAHPLSTSSPFGVSDHLSFLAEIPLDFEYQGRRSVPPMYGPAGLNRIVTQAVAVLGPERASFTLEIHPVAGRLPLGDAAPWFSDWSDLTNAECMNHWLAVLRQNHDLLLETLLPASGASPRTATRTTSTQLVL